MILIDTTPLVALCDARDQFHARAHGDLRKLGAADFAICEPVLSEACFHLRRREQRARLRQLLEQLEVRAVSSLDLLTFWNDVFAWMARYGEHSPDWADAYLAALCGPHASAKVWTYDSEFRTIWRRPDGTAVPMAVRI